MPVVRVLAVLLTALALALPGAAGAQTTASGTPATTTTTTTTTTVQPEVVEPQAGTPVPAQPGATTTVEPVPQPATTSGTPATTGGAPATAGGVVVKTTTTSDSGGSGIDWALVIAIATAVLLLLTALLIALWQLRGWDPRWMRRWRHATAEAGWRLSLGWAEFRDFVRLGR